MGKDNKRDKSTLGNAVKVTPKTYEYLQKIKEETGANYSYIVWKSIITTYKDILEEE